MALGEQAYVFEGRALPAFDFKGFKFWVLFYFNRAAARIQ